MKWVVISGSWRATNKKVENDVRAEVRDIIARGDGIITGGALGVDHIAADKAFKNDPTAQQIKIILPTPLNVYTAHYLKRADEGVISKVQAEQNNTLISRIHKANAGALVEMGYTVCTEETYYARNQAEIDAGDEMVAFQVNGSAGTQDTIDKAREKGLSVKHLSYTIQPNAPQKLPGTSPGIKI